MVCVLPVHQIRSHYGRDPVTVLAEDSSCTESRPGGIWDNLPKCPINKAIPTFRKKVQGVHEGLGGGHFDHLLQLGSLNNYIFGYSCMPLRHLSHLLRTLKVPGCGDNKQHIFSILWIL